MFSCMNQFKYYQTPMPKVVWVSGETDYPTGYTLYHILTVLVYKFLINDQTHKKLHTKCTTVHTISCSHLAIAALDG